MPTLRELLGLQKVGPGTYASEMHPDFSIGDTAYGGSLSALIFHVAETHLKTDSEAVKLNQPDVLKMHIQCLRQCHVKRTTATVKPIKLGPLISMFQVELLQDNKLRCLGIVTAGNFDKSVGPSMKGNVTLHPTPLPKPRFGDVKASKPDPNWVSFFYVGDVVPLTDRLLILAPKHGLSTDGVCDAWYRVMNDDKEFFNPTWVALMADIMPSMSDTLLHNKGIYDLHNNIERANQFHIDNPDKFPGRLENSTKWLQNSTVFNNTVTMDLEFRRRVPEEGLEWMFVRTSTDGFRDGRLYVENMLYNEDMELVCATRQFLLVLEVSRKFIDKKEKSSL